jgi:hypothetical protein
VQPTYGFPPTIGLVSSVASLMTNTSCPVKAYWCDDGVREKLSAIEVGNLSEVCAWVKVYVHRSKYGALLPRLQDAETKTKVEVRFYHFRLNLVSTLH